MSTVTACITLVIAPISILFHFNRQDDTDDTNSHWSMSPLRDLVNVGHHERQGTPKYKVFIHSQKWSICQLANVQLRDSTIWKANLAWIKLPYLHHQINQIGVSATFPRTEKNDSFRVEMVWASAETLYFTSQIGRRHHQIRKEISCHGIVEKIHANLWRKWEVSCHLPKTDAPA